MSNFETAFDAQLWRLERPAFEARVDLNPAAADDLPIRKFCLDFVHRLFMLSGMRATSAVYRQSAEHVPPERQWRTLTITIPNHTVLIVTTTDPILPGAWMSDIVVDGRHVLYSMTYDRPLAEVLGDVAWRGIQANRQANP